MPVTKLIVGGFRSLAETIEIPLAPITLLLGPNSAGKSAVKDAMLAMKAAMCAEKEDLAAILGVALNTRNAQSDAHMLEAVDEDGRGYSLEVTLGCLVELFQQDCIDRYFPNSKDELANEMINLMYGDSVEYSLTERYAGNRKQFRLSINAEPAIQFVDSVFIKDQEDAHRIHLPVPRLITNPESFISGLLLLNLDAKPFKNLQFQLLVDALILSEANANQTESLGVFWKSEDNTLNIRCNYRDGQLDPFPEYWINTNEYLSSPNGPYALLRSVLNVISEMLHQVHAALAHELDLVLVSGSRTSLSEEDVTTQEEIPRLSLPSEEPVFRDGTIVSYAHWLGMRSLNPEILSDQDIEALFEKDDFVNDVLLKDFFSGRRYQVKPEVTQRLTRVLVGRAPDEEDEATQTLQTTLYLQDQHGRNLDFHQVGSGVSFILPVLTALWGAPRSWIEQPELHLHPAAQCEMGDAVIMAFNRGRFSVIETHSEHMILRILKRIRQTSLGKIIDPELRCQPEAVSILYFDPQDDGTTSVHQLRVTRGGDFMDRWPRGFFEERNAELFDE